MSTLLERLQVERDELKVKTDKLNDFIENNPAYNEVSHVQRVLLVTQYNLMTMYVYTLDERIYDLKNAVE